LTPDVKPADREFTTGKQILLTRDNDKLDTMLTKFFEECVTLQPLPPPPPQAAINVNANAAAVAAHHTSIVW
jgi:hypothetical protein